MGVRVDGWVGVYSLTAFKKGEACPQGLGGWVCWRSLPVGLGWMGRGEASRRQCSGQFAIIHVAMLRPSFRVIRRSLPVELWGKIPLIEIYGDH
jgi:hypothetical protein